MIKNIFLLISMSLFTTNFSYADSPEESCKKHILRTLKKAGQQSGSSTQKHIFRQVETGEDREFIGTDEAQLYSELYEKVIGNPDLLTKCETIEDRRVRWTFQSSGYKRHFEFTFDGAKYRLESTSRHRIHFHDLGIFPE